MTKIYIAGKMTGVENYNFPKFDAVEKELKEKGFKVVNPANIARRIANRNGKPLHLISTHIFMREDIKQLLTCDAIYFIPGWEESKGAQIERSIAFACGIRIIETK